MQTFQLTLIEVNAKYNDDSMVTATYRECNEHGIPKTHAEADVQSFAIVVKRSEIKRDLTIDVA